MKKSTNYSKKPVYFLHFLICNLNLSVIVIMLGVDPKGTIQYAPFITLLMGEHS